MPLFVRNDHSILLRGAKNEDTGAYFTAAAVGTWEVRSAASPSGSQLATGSMTYLTGSNGEFRGSGPDDSVALVADTRYWVHVVLTEGGVRGDWEESFVAQVRTGRMPQR